MYAKTMCIMHYTRVRRTGEVGNSASLRRDYGTGSVNEYGYMVVYCKSHPMATSQGKLLVHRGVLYNAMGEGPHPCHWCRKSLPWRGTSAADCINVDHLDFNKLNNSPSNLVASCLDCNTKRAEK